MMPGALRNAPQNNSWVSKFQAGDEVSDTIAEALLRDLPNVDAKDLTPVPTTQDLHLTASIESAP